MRADDRKFVFNSIVVNDAPAAMLLPHPIAAQVSASAITAGANRNPVPAMRFAVTSIMTDDQILGRVVEDATQLTGDERSEERGGRTRPLSRIDVPRLAHCREASAHVADVTHVTEENGHARNAYSAGCAAHRDARRCRTPPCKGVLMFLFDPMLDGSNFVLERRVNRPTRAVARRLRDHSTIAPAAGFALGREGTLFVEGTPRPSSNPIVPGHESWRTTGRLLSARGRRVARVDIEISTWTPGSVSIQLRPLDRRSRRWSARRARRYFALAHAGADRLERLLNETASGGVTIRPIQPRDVNELRDLFWRLSPESRYFRFLSPVNQPGETCLRRLAEVDHCDRDALVASIDDHVVAVARYDRSRTEPRTAEVAVIVEDAWHRHGIATALLRELGGVASERGVERFTATVAAENRAVTTLVRSLPVRATWNWDQGQRHLDVDLHHERAAS